jgi:hypothetical protein
MSEQDRLQRLQQARRLERLRAGSISEPLPEEEPEESYAEGVARRFGEADFAGTAAEFVPEFQRRTAERQIPVPPGFTGEPETSFGEQLSVGISQVGRTGGALVGEALGVVTPDFIRDFFGEAWDYATSTDLGKQAAVAVSSGFDKYQQFKEENPIFAEEFENVLGTSADFSAMFSPRPDLIDLDKKIRDARAAGVKTKLSKEKQAITNMVEPETFTTKDTLELRGPLRTKTWVPSEFENDVIDAIQTIPGLKPYGTITGNFKVIQDHIRTQGAKLDNYVATQNKKINMEDLSEEFAFAMQDFLGSDVVGLASEAAQKQAQKYIALAQKIIKEEGNDLKGLLAARRRFDKAVHDSGGTLEADVATYQAMAAKEVRNVLNNYLKANTKGDEVHHLLDQQFRSLTALDNMVNKRNREGVNAPARAMQIIKDNTGISLSTTLLSVLATGASFVSPAVAAPIAGVAVGTALSSQIRRHGKATVLKSYAELLSAIDKTMKAVTSPAGLEALSLDRLVIVDLMNQAREYEEELQDGR